jgi:hypothetical protein
MSGYGKDNLFKNPDLAVSLLVPDQPNEGVAYKYLKTLAKEFIQKSENPAEFARLINSELGKETSRTRREALFHLKQRAIDVFALDEM